MAEEQEPAAQGGIHIHSVSIQPVCEFNPDAEVDASLATRWNTWIDDFEMFSTASGITDKKQNRALLLYLAGAQVHEIFRQLNDTRTNDHCDIARVKEVPIPITKDRALQKEENVANVENETTLQRFVVVNNSNRAALKT